MFPSPSRGSYFLMVLQDMRYRIDHWFPSPSRGSYFSIYETSFIHTGKIPVSVPFPGILFLNVYAFNAATLQDLVSVPFTGILFLNVYAFNAATLQDLVSVPFTGILFLNPKSF